MLYFLPNDMPNITENVYNAVKVAIAMNKKFIERYCEV